MKKTLFAIIPQEKVTQQVLKSVLCLAVNSKCTVQCVDFQDSEEGNVLPCYTIVQTVFKLGSNRTAFPSTDLALVSYMGFSKAA